MGVRDELIAQHRQTAQVTGQMSLKIEGRSVSTSDLYRWAGLLDEVAQKLRKLATIHNPLTPDR